MAIDTSMYGNVQVPQANIPSPVDMATKAITLNQLGMQNQALQYQRLQQQQQFAAAQSVRQAYSDNTDQNGNLNRQGFLSDLGKNAYTAGQVTGYQKQFAENDKAQAEAKQQQVETAQRILSITEPALEHLASMPEDQRAAAYQGVMKQVAAQGVPMDQVPPTYDPGWFQQAYVNAKRSKDYLANMNSQADIASKQAQTAKTISETGEYGSPQYKQGAEELAKFKDDIVDASSRKTTGSLIDARNRADRILSLVGRQKNEPDQQYYARLNQYMPQVGTEIGTSLAAIMQGGIPNESIQEKLAPDTMQSKLAELQQKFQAEPSAANQGKLLAAYSDIAQKLRDFSAQRLQETTDRARSAYPYANRYFSKEMDKISSPILSPGSAQSQDSTDTQMAGSKNKSGSKFSSGDLVLYQGKHYKVGPDGDSLIPVKGNG